MATMVPHRTLFARIAHQPSDGYVRIKGSAMGNHVLEVRARARNAAVWETAYPPK